MGVLSGEEIKRRNNEIFESGYEEDCVDIAAYNLRINDKNLIIDGELYVENNPWKESLIKLPAKKISVISTIEKIKLSKELCARVGITFTFSRRGLIPLFGPQIDPGYNDYFYAVVYNASSKDISLQKGDKILKMEIYSVKGNIGETLNHQTSSFFANTTEIETLINLTKEETIGKEELRKSLEKLENDIKNVNRKVDEVTSGYRSIVWFGVFLISASIFGVILSFLLSFSNYPKIANLMSGYWLPIVTTLIVILFIIGWIFTMNAVIKNIKTKK